MFNNIDKYIQDKYKNKTNWFEEEVKETEHLNRIINVIKNKEYLNGKHKILERNDIKWKGENFITTKLVLQQAKTILNFHNTYLLGKPISLIGSENMVKEFNKIYRKGKYNNIDFNILKNVNCYGDVFEYVYKDIDNTIKSKIINSECGYPVYAEDSNTMLCFIEYWTSDSNKVSYYTIYYPEKVEEWNNEGGELNLINTYNNLTGLPIHYHNINDIDERYGISELEDIKPIIDCLEDLLSKFNDSIYTLSLNPLAVVEGQELDKSIDADAVGYAIQLEGGGDFNFKSANMDYSSIKLFLDTLNQQLQMVAGIPSVALGNTNVANVSEVSLSMLYNLASMKAMLSEKWLKEGISKRFEKICKLLENDNIIFSDDEYVDIEFNYNKPINKSELLDNLKKQFEMNAISIRSIIEKSDLSNDVTQELERLKEENTNKHNLDDSK